MSGVRYVCQSPYKLPYYVSVRVLAGYKTQALVKTGVVYTTTVEFARIFKRPVICS